EPGSPSCRAGRPRRRRSLAAGARAGRFGPHRGPTNELAPALGPAGATRCPSVPPSLDTSLSRTCPDGRHPRRGVAATDPDADPRRVPGWGAPALPCSRPISPIPLVGLHARSLDTRTAFGDGGLRPGAAPGEGRGSSATGRRQTVARSPQAAPTRERAARRAAPARSRSASRSPESGTPAAAHDGHVRVAFASANPGPYPVPRGRRSAAPGPGEETPEGGRGPPEQEGHGARPWSGPSRCV